MDNKFREHKRGDGRDVKRGWISPDFLVTSLHFISLNVNSREQTRVVGSVVRWWHHSHSLSPQWQKGLRVALALSLSLTLSRSFKTSFRSCGAASDSSCQKEPRKYINKESTLASAWRWRSFVKSTTGQWNLRDTHTEWFRMQCVSTLMANMSKTAPSKAGL